MEQKLKLVSFDIKFFYTNVPTNKTLTIFKLNRLKWTCYLYKITELLHVIQANLNTYYFSFDTKYVVTNMRGTDNEDTCRAYSIYT